MNKVKIALAILLLVLVSKEVKDYKDKGIAGTYDSISERVDESIEQIDPEKTKNAYDKYVDTTNYVAKDLGNKAERVFEKLLGN